MSNILKNTEKFVEEHIALDHFKIMIVIDDDFIIRDVKIELKFCLI